MKQGSLSEIGFVQRKRPTRRAVFLEQMAALIEHDRPDIASDEPDSLRFAP